MGKYTPLVADAKYLLFLAWEPLRDGYWIVASHKGKINIDGKDTRENNMDFDSDLSAVRSEALLKYN